MVGLGHEVEEAAYTVERLAPLFFCNCSCLSLSRVPIRFFRVNNTQYFVRNFNERTTHDPPSSCRR
jgi:hypothetical protein